MRVNPCLAFGAIVCATLTACASPRDRHHEVREKPDAVTFTFSARTQGAERDADDPKAEAVRINTLEQHLRDNQMCPKGYALTSRRVVVQIGERDQIDYAGRCTD